jgi:hypothetical protein
MRYDSCRQCTKRRIICDKGTPRCSKCVKKGIECSGIGKTYRFVQNSTPGTIKTSSDGRGRCRKLPHNEHDAPCTVLSTAASSSLQSSGEGNSGFVADDDDDVEDIVPTSSGLVQCMNTTGPQQETQRMGLHTALITQKSNYPLGHPIEMYKPGQMMLLDHCKPRLPH